MGIQALVSGKVQGVGYRRFAQIEASSLGLKGWVRNLPNGDVELYAEGESDHLDQLVSRLKQGPRYSTVSAVAVTPAHLPLSATGFTIRYDEESP